MSATATATTVIASTPPSAVTLSKPQGYRLKPQWINALSIFYFLLPLVNLSYTLIYSNIIYANDYQETFTHLPWWYFLFLGLPMVAAYGLYQVRLWGWYLFVIHAALVIFSGVFSFTEFTFRISPALASVVFLFPLIYFLRREIRAPYFNPQLRWWEQHARVRERVALRLIHSGKDRFNFEKNFETFDVSEDGCYVVVDNLERIQPGYHFDMELSLGEEKSIPLKVIVVWVNDQANGIYEKGFGAKFIKLDPATKHFIRSFVQNLIKQQKNLTR